MPFFDEYKPFRNSLRRLALQPALECIWRQSVLSVRTINSHTAEIARSFGPVSDMIYPWELAILAKEVILHSQPAGCDVLLAEPTTLRRAINRIRRLSRISHADTRSEIEDTQELHQTMRQQFSWIPDNVNTIMRTVKVFGEATVEHLIQKEFGIGYKPFFHLATALQGSLLRSAGALTDQDYGVFGIPQSESASFFSRLTSTIPDLKNKIAESHSYDRNWQHSWNPLESTPFIQFDPAHPTRVLCPIPHFLTRRTSSGIFYDLINVFNFDTAFGRSFESYIGEILTIVFRPPAYTVLPEQPYTIGKNDFRGADWKLSDGNATLFIETKTKRMTKAAQSIIDFTALDKDLTVLAEAIVQNYRNIRDCLHGHTPWRNNNLPIFSLILTLEDWLLCSDYVHNMLDRHVSTLMEKHSIPSSFLTDVPYTVASAREFEAGSQIIREVGILPFMSGKSSPSNKRELLSFYMVKNFSSQLKAINPRLFGAEFLAMRPKSPDSLGLSPPHQN